VGKWAARLAARTRAPLYTVTDETDKRGVLSVLAVTPQGGARDVAVVRVQPLKDALDAVDLSALAWTDGDIVGFLDRRARLLRWGWAEPDAEMLAERLVIRDRERDDRVSCAECAHYRPGRCGNHRRAGLYGVDAGRDLVGMLQRCPGFQPLR
jgi:hypothetical protein